MTSNGWYHQSSRFAAVQCHQAWLTSNSLASLLREFDTITQHVTPGLLQLPPLIPPKVVCCAALDCRKVQGREGRKEKKEGVWVKMGRIIPGDLVTVGLAAIRAKRCPG